MHLIVGLGNPGAQYARHRHNVGAMAVDAIAQKYSFPPFKNKFKGLFADGKIGSERVLLLKPQTFMNNSGDSVFAAKNFYKLQPGDITVIYDELDLNPGKIRVKTGGGNNGHNGLRSIDPQIGVEYQRVRVGIGHPGQKQLVNSHVLSNFHKIDHQWLDPVLEAIAQNAQMLVTSNASGFMNRLAIAVQKSDDEVIGENKSQPKKTKPEQRPANKNQSTSSSSQLSSMLKKLFNKE